MYDFGITIRAVAKYESSINKFVGESLNIDYKNPTLFDRLRLKLRPVIIERQKTENSHKEIVRIFRNGKLIGEREFEFKIYRFID